MKKFFASVTTIFLAMFFVLVVGCDDLYTAEEPNSSSGSKTVTGIYLSYSYTVRSSSTITAKLSGSDTADVLWEITSGSEYATLSDSKTTATKGTATVTVYANNGTSKNQTVEIQASVGTVTGTTSITIAYNSIELSQSIDKEYWGTWIQMDTGDEFYIDSNFGGVTKCMLAQGSVRSLCKRRRRRTPSSASGDSLRSSRFS